MAANTETGSRIKLQATGSNCHCFQKQVFQHNLLKPE